MWQIYQADEVVEISDEDEESKCDSNNEDDQNGENKEVKDKIIIDSISKPILLKLKLLSLCKDQLPNQKNSYQ